MLGDRQVTLKAKLSALAVLLALFVGTYYTGYLKGWYAHSEKVSSEHAEKNKKAEKTVATGEQKAANASSEGRVIYRTIYRDVVKYVNDPNHTKCDFDDHAVRAPSMRPTPSADLMQEPCKGASQAGTNSDEDLPADIETAECLRQLRLDKYRWQAWYKATE